MFAARSRFVKAKLAAVDAPPLLHPEMAELQDDARDLDGEGSTAIGTLQRRLPRLCDRDRGNLAISLAIEVLLSFEDENVRSALCQQQPQQ